MTARLRPALVLLQVAALVSALGGCGETPPDQPTLSVLAAASLTEPFTELARRFERRHEGVRVLTGFDSSATLAAQVAEGAPADVVATADPRTMQMLVAEDVLAEEPVVFARNRLALVVPPGDPADVRRAADLQGTAYVTCAPAAPCGALAQQVLDDAGVTTPPRSREVDVKAVLTKVLLDEADAGLVYASDVVAAGDRVQEVPLGAAAPGTAYPIAVTGDTGEPELARAFVSLVLSEEGRRVLVDAGFEVTAGGSPS